MSQNTAFDGQCAVHIGPGNFALSHIVPFFDEIGLDVHGISLRTDTVKKMMQGSGFNYTLVARDSKGFFEAKRITALTGITNVPMKSSNAAEEIINKQRAEAVALIGDPSTSIVTMTVTITGYGYQHDPSKRIIDSETGSVVSVHSANAGNANAVRNEVQPPAPINNSEAEKYAETTIAYLVAGLNERFKHSAGPIVVMSLDNLPSNGTNLYRAVTDFALNHYGRDLQAWIVANTFFPDTMVDRIAPKRDETMIDTFIEGTGIENTRENVVIVTEKLPKYALVISTPDQISMEQGHPVNPVFERHPVLEALTQLPGIEQCGMANLYSERKVHVFNGSHFGLAMVGRLAGYEYAHEAITDPAIQEFIEELLVELSAGVHPALAGQTNEYMKEFIDRVSNPHMADSLQRIGRNGSSKLFERVLIPWYLARHATPEPRSHRAIDTVGAAWLRIIAKAAEAKCNGDVFEVEDKNAQVLGLLDMDALMYKDAQLILGKQGVMDKTPEREIFGADLNQAFKELDAILDASRRGATRMFHGPVLPFERPFELNTP